MTGSEDWELDQLRSLDPALRDAPPAPGSVRYDAILERAMSLQTTNTSMNTNQPARVQPVQRRSRRWIGWSAVTGVAAAAVAVVVAVVGTPAPSASAAVLGAADKTAAATSLRYETTAGVFTTKGEAVGDRIREVHSGDGGGFTVVVVGDQAFTTRDGKTTRSTVPDEERRAPFGQAAGKFVRAVASDGDVVEVGSDQVRGVDATHYRLTLPERTSAAQASPKLAELGPEVLNWFDLAGVESYGELTLDVWVADGLVQRLTTLVTGQSATTFEFYDFNAPIKIEPPAGS
jgi:hypothetical protein